MPRVRKFEEDLVMQAYPEGQMIFEGKGVVLLQSREITEISLIESAIEGKDFAGYLEDTGEPLKYTSKLKAGESYMIIKQLFDDNGILTHIDILLFSDIMSDEHTRRRIPFPFDNIGRLHISRIIPMDENHLLFSISDTVNNRQVIQCYIMSVSSKEYRCLGEYAVHSNINSNINSNYILLRKCQDYTIWHYNFSVDDMDEAHEPDIERLDGVHLEHFRCLNSDCIFSVRFRDKEIVELIIFDCQRNQVNLTERFPQLKGLFIGRDSNFGLFELTQDVLSMVFIGSGIKVILIENGELKMSEGEMNFKNVLCNGWKHIDLNDNYFRDEDCVFYGVDEITGRYGPIKFREASKEVFRLNSLHPKKMFFDGIAEVYDNNASIRCYFFFKERKLIVLRERMKPFSRMRYKILSVQPNEGDDFFVMAKEHNEKDEFCVKIHLHESKSKPVITILPHCGSENRGFIQGLPLNVDYRDDDTVLVYLGEKMILEFPPNIYVRSVHGSHFDNSACIVCNEAIHFFRFNVNGYDVEVQNHIVFFEPVDDVYFNLLPLTETPNHQLFIVHTRSRVTITQHLHCLDWSTGSFLEPVLLWKKSYVTYYSVSEEGNKFLNFVGDSYIHVRGGIIKVYVEDGVIKQSFFKNDNLPHYPDMYINHVQNLPNNTVQDMSYEEETKIMVLKTYNIEEDPESTNPTVETFHLPSFLAEASIVEYHMPDYHEHYHKE
ncbi:hypothetical protein PCE1_002664 [Barthelona sp. PCE]